jgi:hypothetical protein
LNSGCLGRYRANPNLKGRHDIVGRC